MARGEVAAENTLAKLSKVVSAVVAALALVWTIATYAANQVREDLESHLHDVSRDRVKMDRFAEKVDQKLDVLCRKVAPGECPTGSAVTP